MRPLRALARRTLDWTSALEGALLPGSISERLADAYGEHLFGTAVLGDLPSRPDFVINATNVSSGALARAERTESGTGASARCLAGDPGRDRGRLLVRLPAATVAARLARWSTGWTRTATTTTVEHRDELVLSDGGVYDNLGLETAWKRCRTSSSRTPAG